MISIDEFEEFCTRPFDKLGLIELDKNAISFENWLEFFRTRNAKFFIKLFDDKDETTLIVFENRYLCQFFFINYKDNVNKNNFPNADFIIALPIVDKGAVERERLITLFGLNFDKCHDLFTVLAKTIHGV